MTHEARRVTCRVATDDDTSRDVTHTKQLTQQLADTHTAHGETLTYHAALSSHWHPYDSIDRTIVLCLSLPLTD